MWPFVHHQEAVGDDPHDGQVVRDEQQTDSEVAAQIAHQGGDAGLGRGVQRRNGFVCDEEVWPGRECPRGGDSLFLSTGELVRVFAGGVGREVHLFEEALGCIGDVQSPTSRDGQAVANLVSDTPSGVEG